jgi:hypothetical protein
MAVELVTELGWKKWHIVRLHAYGRENTLCGRRVYEMDVIRKTFDTTRWVFIDICKDCWKFK